jgi:hypothetical protein
MLVYAWKVFEYVRSQADIASNQRNEIYNVNGHVCISMLRNTRVANLTLLTMSLMTFMLSNSRVRVQLDKINA